MLRNAFKVNTNITRSVGALGKTEKVSIIPNLDHIYTNATKVFSKDVVDKYYDSRIIAPLEKVMKNYNEGVDSPEAAINNTSDINQKFMTQQLKKTLLAADGKKTFSTVSLVTNSSFALSSLTQSDQAENSINPVLTPNLYHLIMKNFGSLEEFEKLLLLSAKNIQGDGFTWLALVTDFTRKRFNGDDSYLDLISENKMDTLEYKYDADAIKIDNALHSLKVLNTYNAGSPFVYEKFNHSLDKALLYIEESDEVQVKRKEELEALRQEIEQRFLREKDETVAKDTLSYMYDMYRQEKMINMSMNQLIKTEPVLGIDCTPKLWLLDYGVEGKMEYLKNLYAVTNWNLIEQRLVTQLTASKV